VACGETDEVSEPFDGDRVAVADQLLDGVAEGPDLRRVGQALPQGPSGM
jgi:hypothetical protein